MQTNDFSLGSDYSNIRPLDEGGMGEVFLARRKGLDVDVVIKRVKNILLGKLDQTAEANILKNLKHQYLPKIYDIINGKDGYLYTIMDYIPGMNLKAWVQKNGTPELDQIVEWGRQLCDVVSYLHRQTPPVIHCDIKPANIMITPQNDICLIDFNISLVFGTRTASLGATNGYASPEQYLCYDVSDEKSLTQTLLQEPDFTDTVLETSASRKITDRHQSFQNKYISPAITEKTDIYGIGAVLYYLLCGCKPECSTGKVTPLPDRTRGVGRKMQSVVTQAMEKEPQKRFSSAEELSKALQKAKIAAKRQKYFRVLLKASAAFVSTALLICGGLHFAKNTKYERLLSQGAEYLEQESFTEAEKVYTECIYLHPRQPDAYTGRAESRLRNYEWELAREDTDKAISLGCKNAKVYELRAEADIYLADMEAALEDLQKAVSLDGNLAQEYASILDSLEKGTLQEEMYQGLMEYSHRLLLENDFENALIQAETALNFNPHSADTYLRIADALYGLNRPKEALDKVRIAMEMDTLLAEDLEERKKALENGGEYQDLKGNIYDGWGNQIRCTYYDQNDTLVWYHEFEYSNPQQVKQVVSYDRNGKATGAVNIQYNDEGKETKTYHYNYNDGVVLPLSLTYDDAGNIENEILYDSEEQILSERFYTYDESGNVKECMVYGPNKSFSDHVTYEMQEDGTRICRHYTESGQEEFYVEEHFNSSGQVINEIYFQADGTMLYSMFYEYDEDGNVSKSSINILNGMI